MVYTPPLLSFNILGSRSKKRKKNLATVTLNMSKIRTPAVTITNRYGKQWEVCLTNDHLIKGICQT